MTHIPSDLEAQRESVKVLEECVELQQKKSRDYQNAASTVTQADYYPRGIHSINDIINAKLLRVKSVIEAMEGDDSYSENFESLEDSYKDLINYASFAVAWCRGKMEGQDPSSGLFGNEGTSRKPTQDQKDELSDLLKRLDEVIERQERTNIRSIPYPYNPPEPYPTRPYPMTPKTTPWWETTTIPPYMTTSVTATSYNGQTCDPEEVLEEERLSFYVDDSDNVTLSADDVVTNWLNDPCTRATD